LGYDALYQEFRLDEPWDSQHNLKLVGRMPDIYRIGSDADVKEGKTCMVLPVGEGTAFPKGAGLQIRQFADGLSNTILAVEVDDHNATPWTKPSDLEFDPSAPSTALGHHYGSGFLALFGDGSVHFLESKTDAAEIRSLFLVSDSKDSGKQ
jgi:hypothetical protein